MNLCNFFYGSSLYRNMYLTSYSHSKLFVPRKRTGAKKDTESKGNHRTRYCCGGPATRRTFLVMTSGF